MNNNDLCPFSKIVEIIKNIDKDKIISYDGTVGTSSGTGMPPYQVIELRIAFHGDEQQKTDWWRNF